MARLYFDLHNGTGFTVDEEGYELSDDEDPRDFAIESIRSLLSEEVRKGVIDLTGWIDIRSESGQKIGQIRFREAVRLRLDQGDADDRAPSRPD